jgi:hypothetical protein
MYSAGKRKRSSSSYNSQDDDKPINRPVNKRVKTSNFSDRPPEEQKPKMSTQEILEYYKKFNPSQSLTNHNKAER